METTFVLYVITDHKGFQKCQINKAVARLTKQILYTNIDRTLYIFTFRWVETGKCEVIIYNI